jgi:hypothetical protein
MEKPKSVVPAETIEKSIFMMRGQRVILDTDLAELYGVETRVLKQAVRRNRKRFPDDFMFELTRDEARSLRSQNVTLKRGQYSKYPPFAFTEQGVAMFSSVLNSDRGEYSYYASICPIAGNDGSTQGACCQAEGIERTNPRS